MTQHDAKNLLPIIEAYAIGKIIQYKVKKDGTEWHDTGCVIFWDCSEYDYRIKPKPREFWVSSATNGVNSFVARLEPLGEEDEIHVIEV